MRLWHQQLISKLPQKQLCGQWRECIALLGNGWGRKHSTVNYVFTHSEAKLLAFTRLVGEEMINRGYHPNLSLPAKALEKRNTQSEVIGIAIVADVIFQTYRDVSIVSIYPEHNEKYYKECIEKLKAKGIEIE